MRVLQIIQKCQLRGAEVFACQLSDELNKGNNVVDIVYLFDTGVSLPFSLKFTSLHGNIKRRFWDFPAYKRLANIIADGNYDLVQANACDTLKYAVLSKRIFKWKTPIIFRNANKMSAFFKGIWHHKFNRWLLSHCHYIISVSENCRRDIISIFPQAQASSETITIGTYDFSDVIPRPLTNERPVIINIGSLVPEKNQSFLIDVFKTFKQKNNGTLIVVGEGKLREYLENKVRVEGLTGQIIFTGATTDVIPLLKSADLLLLTSKIEGLPGVILESLSCGVPVISSDVGGIPEIISDGHTGFLIRDSNVQSYVKKVEECLGNDEIRANLILNGRTLILSEFLLPKIAAKFLDAYDKVLNAAIIAKGV